MGCTSVDKIVGGLGAVWVVLWACVVDRVVVGVVVVVVPEFKITVNTWCANWNPSEVTQMYCPLFVTSKCVITSVFPSLVMCEFGGRSPVGEIHVVWGLLPPLTTHVK